MKKNYEKRRGPTETFTEREKIIEHKKCGDRFFCNLAFLEEKKIIFSSLDDIITFLNPLLSDIDHDAEIICLGALTYAWRPEQPHVSLKL